MLTQEQKKNYRKKYVELLNKSGIILREDEIDDFEITDLGINDFENIGLGMHVYVNTNRYCAKELMLLPHQTCVEHSHPNVDGMTGKMETFRCRYGKVWLYIDGDAEEKISGKVPYGSKPYFTVFKEIELNPGDQYTISHNTKHWFQAGSNGAVLSEFSSTSTDDNDIFTDPRIEERKANKVKK
jgi:D-lyxose ketol-isomerase